ncbi:phospholipase A2 AP-PLA2-II-like [Asterias amurensis]|uniref:phospholipase A2 AP-PLA2-II-like n=1 Tax=Asterias amurensis TaxID=7602 RepID=UPI003AB266B5
MTTFGKLCLFATVAFAAAASIHTTNLVQFGDMIQCLTERSFLTSFLDYEGYGCWCGIGGKGTPLDGTDECCMIHDRCYDAVMAGGRCPLDEYVYIAVYITSKYDCKSPNARVTFARAEDYGYFSPWPYCREAVCQCDRAAAECFVANAFDTTYTNWDKDIC